MSVKMHLYTFLITTPPKQQVIFMNRSEKYYQEQLNNSAFHGYRNSITDKPNNF